jgi:hypothetical protein
VAIRLNINGVVLSSKGQVTATAVRKGPDLGLDITFPEHPDGANFVFQASSMDYHTLVRDVTSTSLVIFIRNSANGSTASTDGHFCLMMFAEFGM